MTHLDSSARLCRPNIAFQHTGKPFHADIVTGDLQRQPETPGHIQSDLLGDRPHRNGRRGCVGGVAAGATARGSDNPAPSPALAPHLPHSQPTVLIILISFVFTAICGNSALLRFHTYRADVQSLRISESTSIKVWRIREVQ